MAKNLRRIYTTLFRVPFLCRFAVGARASYMIHKTPPCSKSHMDHEFLWEAFWNTSKYFVNTSSDKPLIVRKAKAFQLVLKWLQSRIEERGIGILLGEDIPYWYPHIVSLDEENLGEVDNLSPGFDYVIERGLSGVLEDIQNLEASPTKEAFILVIKSIGEFLDHTHKLLEVKKFDSVDGVTSEDISRWISRAPWHPPNSFEEALFSAWLLHLLCWYDNHRLIGLGRLDQWLYPYLEHDLAEGRLTEQQALDSIKKFIRWLNNSRLRKSNLLPGDTGQTLVIGGLNQYGHDATNQLSYLFIKALEELKLPEPKLVARISKGSTDEYITKLAQLIKLNLGYPLLCNDEVVVTALMGAGYSNEDASNYGVAACWEYLIPGYSFDRANVGVISFLDPILTAIRVAKNQNLNTFGEFVKIYEHELDILIKENVKRVSSMAFIPAPLLSIMYKDCIKCGKDITDGGARYNNYGWLGMGLADAVDSLYAIKKAIFENKLLLLEDLDILLTHNFNDDQIHHFLKHRLPKFGNDDDDVDKIAAHIVKIFADLTKKHKTPYGGCFKPGLGSAGGYLYAAKDIPATPNGRNNGAPCAVNLSPSPGATRLGPTAILRSVTKPDLKLMSNCAVVELAINTSFLSHKAETTDQWIKWLIRSFVILDGAEMQFNIIDADVLRQAQLHPELYTNLLVRVWGFNAYFTELPREFQDHIIARVESCPI